MVVETLVIPGRLTWRDVAERMSVAPARIGGLADHGRPIAVGEPANLVLVDPNAGWTVDPSALASKSRNTPFAGRTLTGVVALTLLRGRVTARAGLAHARGAAVLAEHLSQRL